MADIPPIEKVNLEGTYFEGCDVKIIDSNGTKYLVGWDDAGWFSIMHCEIWAYADSDMEHEQYEYGVDSVGEYPITSFTPEGAEELKEMI